MDCERAPKSTGKEEAMSIFNDLLRAVKAVEKATKRQQQRTFRVEKERTRAVDHRQKVRERAARDAKSSRLDDNIDSAQIPEWTETWNMHTDCLSNTGRRRAFYDHWKTRFEAGMPVDVKGNVGYVFAYMRSEIDHFKKTSDIKALRDCFEKIEAAYGKEPHVLLFTRRWIVDAYFYIRDYCGAWDFILTSKFYDNCDIADAIFYDSKCCGIMFDGFTLLGLLRKDTPLTKTGKTYRSEIAQVATDFLVSFHEEHKCNVVRHLYNNLKASGATEGAVSEEIECVAVLVPFSGPPKGVFQKSYAPTYLLQQDGVVVYETVSLSLQAEIAGVLKRIVRESENVVRVRHGLAKVGEGWVSEARLFEALSKRFPNERLVHHARPPWLGRQHLDIYFRDWRIAVEYQGAQHERPVEIFGGVKAFEKQQERDVRKRQKCEQNGCLLVFVYPDDSSEEAIERVSRAIEERRTVVGRDYQDV